jgi:hypothetical protein
MFPSGGHGTGPVPACNTLVWMNWGTSVTEAPAIKRTISAAKSRLQIREFFIRSSPGGVISGRVEKFLSRRDPTMLPANNTDIASLERQNLISVQESVVK